MKNIIGLLCLVCAGFGAQAVLSSGNAALRGTVTDPSGAVIPGAAVTVSGPRYLHTVSTDNAGHYELAGIPAGQYQVSVRVPGFATFKQAGYAVEPGLDTEADAQVAIRAEKQQITVTAEE